MDISIASLALACQIPSSDVTILEGHTSEVDFISIYFLDITFFC